MAWLAMLLVFGDKSVMGVVLNEEDKVKLHYVTSAVTVLNRLAIRRVLIG